MKETPVDLASVYRTMDTLSLQHAPHLGVPTEVRIFGAEISAEVACLSDEELINVAIELDAAAQGQEDEDELLGAAFTRHNVQLPGAYAGDPAQVEARALQQLRIMVVSRCFRAEYAQRFPERAFAGYECSEDVMQGNVLAFRTMGQFLARPYWPRFCQMAAQ